MWLIKIIHPVWMGWVGRLLHFEGEWVPCIVCDPAPFPAAVSWVLFPLWTLRWTGVEIALPFHPVEKWIIPPKFYLLASLLIEDRAGPRLLFLLPYCSIEIPIHQTLLWVFIFSQGRCSSVIDWTSSLGNWCWGALGWAFLLPPFSIQPPANSLEGRRWWSKYLGFCHPCDRHGWNSWLLDSTFLKIFF